MKISARNQFQGKVVEVRSGAVNSVVSVEIAPNVVIQSMITQQAVEALDLAPGKTATVLIKASSVLLGVDG